MKQVNISKFLSTPGLCSKNEVLEAEIFFLEYKNMRDLFREAYGTDPLGYTLESILEDLSWYKKNLKILFLDE